jgi:hypothetical protein
MTNARIVFGGAAFVVSLMVVTDILVLRDNYTHGGSCQRVERWLVMLQYGAGEMIVALPASVAAIECVPQIYDALAPDSIAVIAACIFGSMPPSQAGVWIKARASSSESRSIPL